VIFLFRKADDVLSDSIVKKKTNKNETTGNLILVIAAFSLGVMIIFTLIEPFNDWSFNPNPILFSQFGSFIGGFIGTILSFGAVILLYLTLRAQQSAIEHQDRTSKIESFENTFFNLLRTQQDITNSLKSRVYFINRNFEIQSNEVHGREFFKYAKNELQNIYNSIDNEKYNPRFDNGNENLNYLRQQISEIDLSSSPDFWTEADKSAAIGGVYLNEQISFTNRRYEITQIEWAEIKELDTKNKMTRIYTLFFQQHHSAIGHYFRHLFHLISLPSSLQVYSENPNGKKKYTDFIQAQMSSYELMLLFYNAMAFPKMLNLLQESKFLENLAEEDLISAEHNCVENIVIRKRAKLLGRNFNAK
jgi:hypothetical protein